MTGQRDGGGLALALTNSWLTLNQQRTHYLRGLSSCCGHSWINAMRRTTTRIVRALQALNEPLKREGFEAYYAEDDILHVRHIATRTVSQPINPHRPLTPAEAKRREQLTAYLDVCSEG